MLNFKRLIKYTCDIITLEMRSEMDFQILIIEVAKNVLDIVIVSFIVYFTLNLLVRSTKHTMVINAFFTIVFLYAISVMLDLKTLHALISNITQWGFIIIVILFQNEIKGSLEKFGSIGFFDSSEQSGEFIDELIEVVYDMAKIKQGALITLERSVPLTSYTEKAVKIDAEFSKYLILTIFNKETPLHDGAVILNNGRISYASTYYPISLDINVAKQFGTRHRAALTLSKDTDSLTIIVSEETGKVSVAYKNRLYNHLEREFLKEMITEKIEVNGR